jgi:hypothetical protein
MDAADEGVVQLTISQTQLSIDNRMGTGAEVRSMKYEVRGLCISYFLFPTSYFRFQLSYMICKMRELLLYFVQGIFKLLIVVVQFFVIRGSVICQLPICFS